VGSVSPSWFELGQLGQVRTIAGKGSRNRGLIWGGETTCRPRNGLACKKGFFRNFRGIIYRPKPIHGVCKVLKS